VSILLPPPWSAAPSRRPRVRAADRFEAVPAACAGPSTARTARRAKSWWTPPASRAPASTSLRSRRSRMRTARAGGLCWSGRRGRRACALGVLAVEDRVSPTRAAIDRLRALGLRVASSGVRREVAEAVAAQLGIDRVLAGVLPAAMPTRSPVSRPRASGNVVGDGVNDAAAPRPSAPRHRHRRGSDVALEASDVTSSPTTSAASPMRSTSPAARSAPSARILGWAFVHNLIGIPLAAGALSRLRLSVCRPRSRARPWRCRA
jgi:Cu+-exporting ATPase